LSGELVHLLPFVRIRKARKEERQKGKRGGKWDEEGIIREGEEQRCIQESKIDSIPL